MQELLKDKDYVNYDGYYIINCNSSSSYPPIFFQINETWFEVPPSTYVIPVSPLPPSSYDTHR